MLPLEVQSLEDFAQSRSAAVLYACPMSAVELKCGQLSWRRAALVRNIAQTNKIDFFRWIQLCLLPPSHKRGGGGLGDAAQILASLDADVAGLAWCHSKQQSDRFKKAKKYTNEPQLSVQLLRTLQ